MTAIIATMGMGSHIEGVLWAVTCFGFFTQTATFNSVLSFQNISSTYSKLSESVGGCYLSTANIGDLDGNGVNDMAVGASNCRNRQGSVFILLLNPNSTVKSHTVIGSNQGGFTGTLKNGDIFGSSVADMGDIDDDGVNDLAVGAMSDDDGGSGRGAVKMVR
jgi:hypothetical protein